MPDDLRTQIEIVREMLFNLGVPMIAKPSFEADDIIAHYAFEIAKKKDVALEIFSSDKDLFQLVGDQIKIVMTEKKTNEFIELGEEKIKEKISVYPNQVVDYLSLLGDSADNIPGVRGIGKVTAGKLIHQFGSLENLYENFETSSLAKGLKKKIIEGKEKAFLSKTLIKLDKVIDDLPPLEEIFFTPVKMEALMKQLTDLELTSLMKKLAPFRGLEVSLSLQEMLASEGGGLAKASDFKPFTRREIAMNELEEVIKKIEKEQTFAFDLETTDLNPFLAGVVAVVFVFEDKTSYYLRIMEKSADLATQHAFLAAFKPIFENEKIKKIGHNLKFEYSILKAGGIILKGIHYDTMVAEYLLNPDRNQFNLEDMVFNYFNHSKIKFKELTKNLNSIFEVGKEELKNYTFEDGEFTFLIYQEQQKKITSDQRNLLNDLELPFIEVLGDMENHGVFIDEAILNDLAKDLEQKAKGLEKNIHELAGEEFNVNSTKQLQKILFEKLAIKPIKKMKTGFSTDNFVLERLAFRNEIAEHILNYRKCNKLLSTYVNALPKLLSPITKRVHTNYNQTVASTGRLSSSNPNLQNIPVGEENHGIRRAFIAPEGFNLVSLDYSQVELRVLAWLAKEETFLAAYENDLDIHKKTASLLFNKPLTDITASERNIAKTINFSVIYGVSPHALSEQLKIPYQEANSFIEVFFISYPRVREYQEEILHFARLNGFVETHYQRRRYVANISSSQFFLKARAERIAFNTVIQGTASDIIKKAMLNIHRQIKRGIIKAKMVMQVHDELVFYIEEKATEENVEKIARLLVEVPPFDRILKVGINVGKNWQMK